ncbi:protein of unknown function [Streptantibioticus cattleyicolor NRRL 8057 = DSM 46488]|nr:protein of unknown function [Streptantibioticus cattleyicolor NRRL 8057 = DSM 46488]
MAAGSSTAPPTAAAHNDSAGRRKAGRKRGTRRKYRAPADERAIPAAAEDVRMATGEERNRPPPATRLARPASDT